MADVPFSPLTEQHLADIDLALSNARVARAQLVLAQRAGLDVSALQDQLDKSEAQLRQIKQVYFPGRV